MTAGGPFAVHLVRFGYGSHSWTHKAAFVELFLVPLKASKKTSSVEGASAAVDVPTFYWPLQ